MEFRPSPRDVIDAFKYRIEHDDYYVISSLVECGLDNRIFDNKYAKQFILKDFRKYVDIRFNTESYEVTDTFKRFVDNAGRYTREVEPTEDLEMNCIILELNEDSSFYIYTHTVAVEDSYTIVKNGKREFDTQGIEMKRTIQTKYVSSREDEEEFTSSSISTRNEDMVTFTTLNDGTERTNYLVFPDYETAQQLEPYKNLDDYPEKERQVIIRLMKKITNLQIRKGLEEFIDTNFVGDEDLSDIR